MKLALDEQSGLDEGDRMLLDRLSQTLAHGCLHLFTLSAREGTVEPRIRTGALRSSPLYSMYPFRARGRIC